MKVSAVSSQQTIMQKQHCYTTTIIIHNTEAYVVSLLAVLEAHSGFMGSSHKQRHSLVFMTPDNSRSPVGSDPVHYVLHLVDLLPPK